MEVTFITHITPVQSVVMDSVLNLVPLANLWGGMFRSQLSSYEFVAHVVHALITIITKMLYLAKTLLRTRNRIDSKYFSINIYQV
jgi:hypothetical protein